jgi:DNA polymerase V
MEKGLHLRFFVSLVSKELNLPLITSYISAGFPSPAADFIEQGIDLNEELIDHPSATFYAYVEGRSMTKAGIDDGDLLVIDRSLKVENGSIVICSIDGEFTVKRIEVGKDHCRLIPENDEFQPIIIEDNERARIWGVVSYSIKPHQRPFPKRKIACTR